MTDLITPFTIARLPRLIFGAGSIASLPGEARAFGTGALIVTGRQSFMAGLHWPRLEAALADAGLCWRHLAIGGEPSPDAVDEAVARHRGDAIDVVIGIGGGSALDAAKAIAGLLRHDHSVLEHLEGVGPERPYEGPTVPFIAVPTTAGTGSEATKNAVLSRRGPRGFKKSFRDEALVARVAIVDPDLLGGCPRGIIAANGMDAFTQLLESFVSIRANAMTDALAWSGMRAFRDGFFSAWRGDGPDAPAGRSAVAYASLMSGICLAQTGLGSVHGLASPLGAFYPIPHGVCCGTLVAAATAVNIAALAERDPRAPALAKYARVGGMLANLAEASAEARLAALVATLEAWTAELSLPRLSAFGMGGDGVAGVVAESRGSSMKTNPIVLSDGEIETIVRRRL
ncbi:MAG: iron-containing alcohol dehydrogenase [Rhodospirillales bacterium]|nr:iron-containing alcohol dehydrogenase [Rhodospirillales bacterium]